MQSGEITSGSYTFSQKGNDLIIRFAVPDKSKTGIGGTGGFSSVGGFGGMNIISSVTIDIWTIKGGALQPGGFNNNLYDGSGLMSGEEDLIGIWQTQ